MLYKTFPLPKAFKKIGSGILRVIKSSKNPHKRGGLEEFELPKTNFNTHNYSDLLGSRPSHCDFSYFEEKYLQKKFLQSN